MSPEEILQQYWGYSSFRPLQRDIIEHALRGEDVLALLPTGGGKSICYQVPGMAMDGICIVISPLIALMKDQVSQLQRRGISAAAVFSGMNHRALDIVFDNAVNGAYKFLYLSPERLQTQLAIERIKRMRINLLAVDEAHCISQWGYDFRPPYLQIAEVREFLPVVPVMALTATATQRVVEDIQVRLKFKRPNVISQSFQRSNLSYSVLYESEKIAKTIEILKRVSGSAVVYSRSRGETKTVSTMLKAQGISADFYHAGLTLDERSKKQDDWIKNNIRVMVSTNAFGMGIDKPDVRVVVHLSLPDSLEAYFQEAGRAGRDGNKAYSVLLYNPSDAQSLRYQLGVSFPPIEDIRRVYRAMMNYCNVAVGSGALASFPFEMAHFVHTFQLDEYQTYACLRILELDGWCVLSESGIARSKAMVLINAERAYDYQLRGLRGARELQELLRKYTGVQSDLVEISEQVIANSLKVSVDEVVKNLNYLHKETIIEYAERSVKPQITMLRERVQDNNLTLDMESFSFRKQNATEKVEAAIAYAETRTCRSQQLLAYFNDYSAQACGICDICTGRNKPADAPTPPIAEISALALKIQKLLHRQPLTLEQVLESWPPQREVDVENALQELIDAGMVTRDEEGKLSCT